MKTPYMVVSFSEEGEATALHREQFPLGFLGKQRIERASDIKFDEESQTWEIHLLGEHSSGTCYAAGGFTCYDRARDVEVGWLEESALLGVEPLSSQGIEALKAIRRISAI